MTNRRAHYDAQPVYHLPPPEVLLIKRDPHNLIPTPVDGRGLVDTKGLLIEMAKTVDPSYKWASRLTTYITCSGQADGMEMKKATTLLLVNFANLLSASGFYREFYITTFTGLLNPPRCQNPK